MSVDFKVIICYLKSILLGGGKVSGKPFLTFETQRELVYFLSLLDKFWALRLNRILPLFEPFRTPGQEGYASAWTEDDCRAVVYSIDNKKTGQDLPDAESQFKLYLKNKKGCELEIKGGADFIHSQKLSEQASLFLRRISDEKEALKVEMLLGRIHGLVLERMEEYENAQAFADALYRPLEDWLDKDEKIPF